MSEPIKPRRRRRPGFSCEDCRRRKIKCDRTYPCKHCRQLNIACHYPDGSVPLTTHASPTASPHRRVEPLTPISNSPPSSLSLGTLSLNGTQDGNPTRSLQISQNPANNSTGDAEDSPKVRELLEKVKRLERSLSEYTSQGAPKHSSSEEPSESSTHLRGVLSKTRFFGQNHWMNFIGVFDTIAAPRYESIVKPSFNDAIMMTNVPAVLKKCKSMAKASKLKIYDEWAANPDFRALVPSPEICEALLNAYFRTSESAFRVFHIPTFWKEYGQYRQQPLLASDSFILRMLLAMAIGVTFYQEPDAEALRVQAKKWIHAGQLWISEIAYQKSRLLNIAGLQLHCLLLLARQELAVVADMSWLSTGTLVRQAFSMGLHKDPSYFPSMSVLQAEIRRRLWATVVELNVQFSVESGMRSLICIEDFDTKPPANADDCDIDESTTDLLISKPSYIFTQTSMQITLLSSLETRLEILKACNDLKNGLSYEEASRLGKIISENCKNSSFSLRRMQQQDGTASPTQLQCNMLDIYLRRFLVILYGMFAAKPQDDPRYFFARKICLDSALTIVSYPSNENGTTQSLESHPYDDYTCVKARSGGFFDNVLTHSMMIIYLELVSQLKEQDSSMTQRDLRQPLKNILRGAIDLLAVRISMAENNVKGHLLFCAALGQIEAIEAGESPYEGAVKNAKRSADICFEKLAEKEPVVMLEEENALQDEINFGMQDWSMDFVMPDAWLFSGWDGAQQ